MPRKNIDKPRNAGTMTESAFWSWIRSLLRKKTFAWKPIKLAKDNAKRPNQSSNKRLKWEYQCNKCLDWFPDKEIEVDHIIKCGNFSKETAGEWIEKLFCEVDGLQILCKACHQIKTHV